MPPPTLTEHDAGQVARADARPDDPSPYRGVLPLPISSLSEEEHP